MVFKYNKLIRDKIGEIFSKRGKKFGVHNAVTDSEYWFKLKQKLQEEINEFGVKEDIESIADVYEVLDAMADFKNFNPQEIAVMRENKNIEFGKFNNRVILEESEEEFGKTSDQ
ncbi:MAG: nucleoside triphosphate pyrophosphohydrolase [bacterium]|nr:nucleoside triphosphate pyrophosphohydrolase [bacterium]